MIPRRSRRSILTAGLGLAAVALAACTKAAQARVPATSAPTTSVTPKSTATGQTAATSKSASTSAATPSRSTPTGSVGPSRTPPARPTATRTSASTAPIPRPTSATAHLGPARQVADGPQHRPSLALTFHGAGDIAYARKILQIVRTKHAHITVMAVGTWLTDNPSIGREILAGGHDLGNHTLSHVDINSLPLEAMRAEVVGCRDILRRTTGTPGSFFRPSQSQTANQQLLEVASQAGYAVCLSYNLDSMDWTDPGAQAVRNNVAVAAPGAIVSMHLGHAGTVDALPDILDDLTSRGLTAVTATKLLSP